MVYPCNNCRSFSFPRGCVVVRSIDRFHAWKCILPNLCHAFSHVLLCCLICNRSLDLERKERSIDQSGKKIWWERAWLRFYPISHWFCWYERNLLDDDRSLMWRPSKFSSPDQCPAKARTQISKPCPAIENSISATTMTNHALDATSWSLVPIQIRDHCRTSN